MLRGIYYGKYVRKYFMLQTYTNSYCPWMRRAIHGTSVSSHSSAIDTSVNKEAFVKQGSMRNIRDGPSLRDFVESSIIDIPKEESVPYVQDIRGENQKGFFTFLLQSLSFIFVCYKIIIVIFLCILVYFEIYGCQMNINDTDIIWSILKSHGYKHTQNIDDADIILLVTCSIRDNAEQKVWNKLELLNSIRKKKKKSLKIGLLGKLFINTFNDIKIRNSYKCS